MQMMLRDLYDDDPTGAHMHYALTEVADECRHSTMFGKSIAHFGVPAYGPPRQIHRLGRLFNHVVRGPGAYASILVAEEILDTWQRDLMKDERVQPVTRMVRAHPRARGGAAHDLRARGGAAAAARASPGAQLVVQQTLTAQTCLMVARSLVNPQGLPLGRHRPARGPAYGAGQPALPRDDAVDGREAARLPPRERPAARRARSASGGLRCCWAEAGRFQVKNPDCLFTQVAPCVKEAISCLTWETGARRKHRPGDLAQRDPAAERAGRGGAQGHDVAVLEERRARRRTAPCRPS